MFTGIIETQGVVTRIERVSGGGRIEIYAPEFGRDMAIGDSVAVDGVCLTVAKFIRGAFIADVSSETIERTTLGKLVQGGKANLERALRLSDRLGGHLVSGHIDAVGRLSMRQPAGNSSTYQFQIPASLLEFVVPKGSIAIDGVSLTIAAVRGETISCAVVPHTEQVTTLGDKPIGAQVNVETDMLAKYVKRTISVYAGQEGEPDVARESLTDMLREFGGGR